MTKKEAVIVSAYTGYLLVPFGDVHEYIEKKMGRPVMSDFLGIKITEADHE